jgi:hypothetical protein
MLGGDQEEVNRTCFGAFVPFVNSVGTLGTVKTACLPVKRQLRDIAIPMYGQPILIEVATLKLHGFATNPTGGISSQ